MSFGRERWDVLRKAGEIAELVENWRLETLQEGESYALVGSTKHAGFWQFFLSKYRLEDDEGNHQWVYLGTVSTSDLSLALPAEIAQRIFEHAKITLKVP